MQNLFILILTLGMGWQTAAQEVFFANYFDIGTDQNEGSIVFGKINWKIIYHRGVLAR